MVAAMRVAVRVLRRLGCVAQRRKAGNEVGMKFARLCMPALVLAALCGCAENGSESVSDGSSAAVEASGDSGEQEIFGVTVPDGDAQKLRVAEEIRATDPCGFFDQDRIGEVGRIDVLGPTYSLSECEIGFLQYDRREFLSHLTIEMDTPPPEAGEPTRQIAGEAITVDTNSSGDCSYKVPMRFAVKPSSSGQVPDVEEVPTVAYAKVSSAAVSPAELGCQLVEETVASIVDAFREQRIPRRDQSVADVPLADRSPCELLPHMPNEYTVIKFDAGTAPYECNVTFEAASSQAAFNADRVMIDLRLSRAETALEPFGNQTLGQVAGVPALIGVRDPVANEEPRCSVHIPVGPTIDASLPDNPKSDRSHWQSRVTVGIWSVCRVTDVLGPIAVKVFGAAA